jgi:ribosomal protein S18 acetylase RimI-like enzyme
MPVRPAKIEDLPAVARLYVVLKNHHRELQPFNPRYHVEDREWQEIARRALLDEEVAVFVAERDGAVRGFVKLSIAAKPWGLSCEMDTLVVDEGWRSRGIGKELLLAAEDHAAGIGARGLRANVLVSNEEGRAFYEREGYALLAVRYGKSITGQETTEPL